MKVTTSSRDALIQMTGLSVIQNIHNTAWQLWPERSQQLQRSCTSSVH